MVIGSTNSSSTSRSLTTQNCAFLVLQERFGDRLLTVLTILFALLLFVIAPLHAAGNCPKPGCGAGGGLFVVIVTVLFAYGISVAVVMMLLGFGVALAATVLRHRHQTSLDLYLDATLDPPGPHFELRCRPCRVRARTHHLPSHHGSNSALPDDRRDLRRALHLGGLADSGYIRACSEGHPHIRQHDGLFQLWHADDRWIRRYFAFVPDSAQPHQCGGK